ncbi:MAG: hypothetical protein LBS46_09090 [Dysgonamonadaceae bacterium]|jgi:hypothetical protein|nr:hypothetical protein [Dysgonamonadaceae bacterium]
MAKSGYNTNAIKQKSMKHKAILFISITLLSIAALSAQTHNDRLKTIKQETSAVFIPNDSAVSQIAKSTQKTAENTLPSEWDKPFMKMWNWWFSLIAALGTIATMVSIWWTYNKRQIQKDVQKNILIDLIRHLYRNKIVVCTLRWKLSEKEKKPHTRKTSIEKYNLCYPSEEHVLKLKILPEDLHLDKFENAPKHYDKLHEMELLFRNYNVEIDVALEHLKQKEMPKEIKERDLGTLEFKSQHLTKKIVELMKELNFQCDDPFIIKILRKKSTEVLYTDKTDTDGNRIMREKIKEAMDSDKYKKALADVPPRVYPYYEGPNELKDYWIRDIALEYSKKDTIGLIKFNTPAR